MSQCTQLDEWLEGQTSLHSSLLIGTASGWFATGKLKGTDNAAMFCISGHSGNERVQAVFLTQVLGHTRMLLAKLLAFGSEHWVLETLLRPKFTYFCSLTALFGHRTSLLSKMSKMRWASQGDDISESIHCLHLRIIRGNVGQPTGSGDNVRQMGKQRM